MGQPILFYAKTVIIHIVRLFFCDIDRLQDLDLSKNRRSPSVLVPY